MGVSTSEHPLRRAIDAYVQDPTALAASEYTQERGFATRKMAHEADNGGDFELQEQ